MMIARAHDVPYVVRPLGLLNRWSLTQSRTRKQIYLRLVERRNLDGAATIQYTTEAESGEANELRLRAPSAIIPHGVHIPTLIPDARSDLRLSLGIQHEQKVILYLSRLHEKKGLDVFLRALTHLRSHPFTFVIAGSGEPAYEAHLRTLITDLGLDTHVRMVGFADGDMKSLLMQGADLFVLTSHSENFGISVLEALAAGLPVLVTPGVALSDVVRQHQLGSVVDLDAQALAEAVQQHLNVADGHVDLRARAFAQETYAWCKVAARLQQIYANVSA